jgi:hypothetical protein
MDEQKLDFSLPKSRQPGNKAIIVLIILVISLAGLTGFNIYVTMSGRQPAIVPMAGGLSAKQAEELATKLGQRNLYAQAAKVWQDYLAGEKLTEAQRAKVLFNTASLLEKAGLYSEAVEYYYRSELTGKLPELEPGIKTGVENCFERMGKFSALRYELMERTSIKKGAGPETEVVAEIGPEKITSADLDGFIENSIDNQLSPISQFMTAEQLSEQKKKMLEQFKSPQVRQQFLRKWIMQEMLYRQALEQGLSDEPKTRRLINDITREVLSQQMMDKQLASKIHVTETDLKTYYEANKDKFVEDVNDPNEKPRQKSFDEARQQVAMALMGEKRRDVQQQYIEEMMNKYNVIIHNTTSKPGGQGLNEQQGDTTQK